MANVEHDEMNACEISDADLEGIAGGRWRVLVVGSETLITNDDPPKSKPQTANPS